MSKLQLSLTFARTISKELGLPHITILSFFHGDGVAVVVVMEMMAMVVVEVVMVVMMMVMVLVVVVVMEMMVMVMAMLLLFPKRPTERSNHCAAPLDGVQFH